jgi:hypothetical protein
MPCSLTFLLALGYGKKSLIAALFFYHTKSPHKQRTGGTFKWRAFFMSEFVLLSPAGL